MRAAFIFGFGIVLAASAAAAQNALPQPAPQTQIVDAIVAHIEDDIITLSEIRELAAYQQLLDGRSQSNEELRSELIEQWVVNNEATTTGFPLPARSEVDREVSRVEATFSSPAAYQQRLDTIGLTADAVRRMITRQIYLARYLDYKFRSSIQVNDSAIADYYRDHLVPQLQAKGQPAPPLTDVTNQIREVLIEQGVNDRTAAWFDETKPRLKIELEPMEEFSVSTPDKP
jgi:parvulin-like peptidyl-prolyl isomerase